MSPLYLRAIKKELSELLSLGYSRNKALLIIKKRFESLDRHQTKNWRSVLENFSKISKELK